MWTVSGAVLEKHFNLPGESLVSSLTYKHGVEMTEFHLHTTSNFYTTPKYREAPGLQNLFDVYS